MPMHIDPKDTKSRILYAALALFALHGYEAVSMAEIADAVGIRAPSLYKHYNGKRAIFEGILAEMAARYEAQAATLQLHGSDAGADAPLYAAMGERQLIEMARGLFLYFLHDEYTRAFRMMLGVERHHSPELAALYARQYIDAPLEYQGMLFGMLAGAGVLLPEPPDILALQFYAPLYLLLALCDCHPEREAEALALLERHIRQFHRLYGAREGNHP